MAGLWNVAKEAARAAKGLMSKNARNATKAEAKKERGPVKAFFHITNNESVPDIERSGLLTNPPGKVNKNSAEQPFKKLGIKGGGVWVTDRPTAFPVYGTTVGGKNGNSAARADALTTFKIELPVSELKKLPAVYNPYGRNMRLTDASHKLAPFGTWTGKDVGVTALLKDIPPEKIKNIGYVEELNPSQRIVVTRPEIRWEPRETLDPETYGEYRNLSKADRAALSGVTGHDKTAARDFNREPDMAKSPARFVEDYIDKNEPIIKRLPMFPRPEHIEYSVRKQGADLGPKYVLDGIAEVPAPNEVKRYSTDFIPAFKWTEDYHDYIKPGESLTDKRNIKFVPGAISRGYGGISMPPIKQRNFDWTSYKRLIANNETPSYAAYFAAPSTQLNWDNIVYKNGQYMPEIITKDRLNTSEGAITRGMQGWYLTDFEGNAMFNGDENLNQIVELVKRNGPQMYADEFNQGLDARLVKDIKDINKPTWQEIVRSLMKLRYLDPQ